MSIKDDKPLYESAMVFELEPWHNHASCIVQLPNDDLLLCWFHGSGEREADDVIVEAARLSAGSSEWGERFLLADTPDYPDCNPCMFLDHQDRLWLIYVTILANEWHTALLKYRVSADFVQKSVPVWESSEVLHVTPGEEFATTVNAACDADALRLGQLPRHPQTTPEYLAARRDNAADKLYRRLGWMTRAHPTILSDGRIVLPLYSDGFDFSLMAFSDDNGSSWRFSLPLISFGGIQPTIVEKREGTLVAYMRDNGPPPKRVMRAESFDKGETWSVPVDTDIPNPGSGLEVIWLQSGRWLMVCNDTEEGRHQLVVMLSEDEGESWTSKRYLEQDMPAPHAGSYSYPSVVQCRDGMIHVSYSYHLSRERRAIKWARFNELWIKSK